MPNSFNEGCMQGMTVIHVKYTQSVSIRHVLHGQPYSCSFFFESLMHITEVDTWHHLVEAIFDLTQLEWIVKSNCPLESPIVLPEVEGHSSHPDCSSFLQINFLSQVYLIDPKRGKFSCVWQWYSGQSQREIGHQSYRETNSTRTTQHILTKHKTSSKQKNLGFLTSELIIGR